MRYERIRGIDLFVAERLRGTDVNAIVTLEASTLHGLCHAGRQGRISEHHAQGQTRADLWSHETPALANPSHAGSIRQSRSRMGRAGQDIARFTDLCAQCAAALR